MKRREPNFENVLKVFRGELPDRPVLYELFMNMPLYELVNGRKLEANDRLTATAFTAEAFAKMGYDYCTSQAAPMGFPTNRSHRIKTISLNEGWVIEDWKSFEEYPWPEPDSLDYSMLEDIGPLLPDGMKLMVMGPGGVLENVIALMGYDNLCYAMHDEPDLVKAVFDQVGSRLLRYYEIALQYDTPGFICSNDDWGFNTQTFLSPDDMRKYVFPWHKKIVDAAHAGGRPVMLHSCGCFRDIIEDVIGMGYDGRHSYEDVIMPVEEAYEAYGSRIAILGGIDVDFIMRNSVEAVKARCAGMLERSKGRGRYMLGTGNSVPEYIPVEKFLALVETATGYNPLNI